MTRIGASNLEIFPLVLGGNTFGWTSNEEDSHRVLDRFVELGGNSIDTADGYSSWVPGNHGGESELIIGSWLARRRNREQIIIGTKVSRHPDYLGLSAANIVAAADASLGRLGTDYIDLYYAHHDDPTVPLEETASTFNDLLVAGKIRAVALSNYSGERVQQWISIAERNGWALPIAVQPAYNLVNRQRYEADVAPVVAANRLGVIPYAALASGFLTGKYRTHAQLEGTARGGMVESFFSDAGLAVIEALETIAKEHETAIATVAIAWLAQRPGIVAPIASASAPDQLPALMDSADLTLLEREIASLDQVSARVPAK